MRLFIFLTVIVLSACGSPEHTSYGPAGGEPAPAGDGGEVRFQEVASQVLDQSCTGCHRAGGRLVDLSSYVAVVGRPGLVTPGNPAASRLYTVIASGQMPPSGPLSGALQELVARWIQQGAKE